jgi:hypothetical protein
LRYVGTHKQEAKRDAANKYPFRDIERDLDRTVVSAFPVDDVGPCLGSDHCCGSIDIQGVYREILEEEDVDEEVTTAQPFIRLFIWETWLTHRKRVNQSFEWNSAVSIKSN